ncbi:hypothetical protein LCGC14_1450480, partial [marine sediment metagenome]
IETNRDYHLTRAPGPLYRYIAMRALTHPKKFLSIEPICDFDLDEMLSWIKEIAPQTFLLTTIMAGAGQVVVSSSQAFSKTENSLKEEIGENHPLFKEFIEKIRAQFAEAIRSERGGIGLPSPMSRQEEEIIKRDIANLKSKLPTAPAEETAQIESRIARLEADLERGEALIGVTPEIVPEVKPIGEVKAELTDAIVVEVESGREAPPAIARDLRNKGLEPTRVNIEPLVDKAGEQWLREWHQNLVTRKPPAVEAVAIQHKGTEPEGIAIGNELGVRYEGVQEGIADVPSTMMFTDVQQTGSTFTAKTLEEAQTKLTAMREAFAPTKPPVTEVEIQKQLIEKPLKQQEEVQVEQIQGQALIEGQPKLTPAQIDALTGFFGEYINNPSTVNAWELTRELRRETLAGRAEELKRRTQDLIVREGLPYEQAIDRAMKETLSGELPRLTSDYLDNTTAELRDALFGKVYHVLKDEPLEMASTITALTNALMGKPIPREPGIRGGSAFTRLQRVFGGQPKVLAAIDKMASEKKPLKDVVEGIFHETGRAPIPLDEATAEYLRNLPTWGTQESAQLKLPGAPRGKLTFNPSGKLGVEVGGEQLALSPDEASAFRTELGEARTPENIEQGTLEMKIYLGGDPKPPIRYDPPIDAAFKELPLWPEPYKAQVVRVLKEIGMSPVDIGNFLRANKASFDFSFWRQQAPLIASHPIAFAYANIASWNATWSLKAADAYWSRITRDPLYEMYTIGADVGGDFLRPHILEKGMGQYRGTEEFGFIKGSERLIPRLTSKIPWVKLSQRGFEAGTNEHNWLIYKAYYRAMLKLSEMYASGRKTLPEGQLFDIGKEMVDFSKMLTNFTARGSLGSFSSAAPTLSGLFFAPRASVGRIMSVKDLLNSNPRVRREAWKNAALFVSVVGGIILMGAYAGWWSVEKDPRSAEYMSIRLGNTRIDPWGGFRQFLVFFTRAFTKTGVSSVTGAEYEADPINLLQTLVRGKASPLASTILDFWRGKNFVGEEVDVANKEQWAERIAPFSIWDIYEAYKDDPTIAMQAAIPAILGAGVQTYTGDWKDDFAKLGLPKYSENLGWGIREPYYDTGDFWADTTSRFAGVDPATLTEQKGFPEYIRDIVKTREIKERLATLPNDELVGINADPNKGITYVGYYEMWRGRERIVASGDEDVLKEFDELNKRAYLGNFSQRQFALLNEYWSITDKEKQDEFLELHEDEIGTNLRKDYLRTHPGDNAHLAIWQQEKVQSIEAYNQTKSLAFRMDIPDNAFMDFLPSEEVVEVYFKISDTRRSDVLKKGTTKEIAEMYLEYSELYDAGTKGAHGRGEDYRRDNPEL